MPAVIVLDAGTGGAKCAIFDPDGRRLAAHREAWGYQTRVHPSFPGIREFAFDPDDFWAILCRCLHTALERAGLRATDVIGVAATSQREGCVFLGGDGRELYAGPNLDARAFNEGLEILNTLGAQRLYEITGHSAPFIFPLARYLWFRKNDRRAVAHALMINDWITYRLSGALVAEPSNATESMLFDLNQRSWSREVLDLFSIPISILPRVGQPGERVGAVTAEAARATGLSQGTPVFLGGADTQCALLGSGAIEPGDTAAVLGTTTPVQMVVDRALFDHERMLWAGCHVVPDRWVIESNAGDTGDAYHWFLDLLLDGSADRYARAEELARAQADVETLAYVGPQVFDVSKIRYDKPGGILFPFPMMHMRPSAGQFLRAFLESVAFAVRGNLEQLRGVTGHWPDHLIAGGGMCRNRLLTELLANVTELPVQQAEEPESAALGVAMLVAAGAGLHTGTAGAAQTMGRRRRVDPDPGAVDYYRTKYAKWRELYDALDRMSI
jgi:sugar (pentulose or hexulose) kinase